MTNSSRITKKWSAQAALTGFAMFACVLSCQAQVIIIDLPDLLLQPNTPNQSFDLFVQNGGTPFAVTGILTETQVADGGPEAGFSIDGPSISNVDVITGRFSQATIRARSMPVPLFRRFMSEELLPHQVRSIFLREVRNMQRLRLIQRGFLQEPILLQRTR